MLAVVRGVLGLVLAVIALMKGKQDRRNGTVGGWLALGGLLLPSLSRISSANHVIVGVGMLLFFQIGPLSLGGQQSRGRT